MSYLVQIQILNQKRMLNFGKFKIFSALD